jgi:hypothetical protein
MLPINTLIFKFPARNMSSKKGISEDALPGPLSIAGTTILYSITTG